MFQRKDPSGEEKRKKKTLTMDGQEEKSQPKLIFFFFFQVKKIVSISFRKRMDRVAAVEAVWS